MKWLNEPARWAQAGDELNVTADAATDFWRVTGNGNIRDSGHVYGDMLAGEFDLSMRIHGSYGERYDQAGAMVRVDERHWIKTGVEYLDGRPRFSVVVTMENSNWTFAELPNDLNELNLLLSRRGDAIEVRYAIEDRELELAAVLYLPPDERVMAGAMCAAPQGSGFQVTFNNLKITNP